MPVVRAQGAHDFAHDGDDLAIHGDGVRPGGVDVELRELAEAALKNGKHVVCEKPLGMTSKETAKVTAAVRKKGAPVFAVNYMCRFFPAVLQMRAMVRRGDLGKIIHVQGHFFQDWLLHQTDYNWRIDPTVSGVGPGAPLPLAASMTDAALRLNELDALGLGAQAVSVPPFLMASTSTDADLVRDDLRQRAASGEAVGNPVGGFSHRVGGRTLLVLGRHLAVGDAFPEQRLVELAGDDVEDRLAALEKEKEIDRLLSELKSRKLLGA